jgi:hypothetical protein
MILDYLWRYPPYIILLIMAELVSVSYPSVSHPPVYTVVTNIGRIYWTLRVGV